MCATRVRGGQERASEIWNKFSGVLSKNYPLFHALPPFSCTCVLKISGSGTLTPNTYNDVAGRAPDGYTTIKTQQSAQIRNLEIETLALEIIE